ncbi:MAG: DUF5010 domain-containing protein [Verrucomicrobiae bacterium]|nr:DUF5010 domain-containing protein [Verrucomicrobiae bacterium]
MTTCIRALGFSVSHLLTIAFVLWNVGGGAQSINPPLGPYLHPRAEDLALAKNFTSQSPVVLTTYFYWYDVLSGAHLTNHDGSDALTDHPPTLTGFSYKLESWHREQLEDMIAAGIDVLLPVYWGEPSQRLSGQPISSQPWSFSGLPPLVAARAALVAEGAQPPGIGLFYDTSTLQHNAAGQHVDLTTEAGQRWFYESIRDFFSLVPAWHWATIEGRPIIFLYSASFAAAHDQGCIDYVRQEFAKDFSGCDPYIVREISWNVTADNTYAWGGALGLRNSGVAALGPGYDHSAVPGRTPLVVPREEGAFFERNWIRLLRAPTRLVHIETWNEYHEGTDIAASLEYGRQYIELNRQYVDWFKAGVVPPRPRGDYSDFKSIRTTLSATNDAHGLIQFESADGVTTNTVIGGQPCRVVVPTIYGGRYIYLKMDDSFKWADTMLVDVEVDYFDTGSGSFHLEYDGSDTNAPFNGAYTASGTSITLGGSGQWKTARFRLSEARFLNSQNGGADFRIALSPSATTLHVREVRVMRLGVPVESGQNLHGWQQDFGVPLETNWVVRGDPQAFQQQGGVLRVQPITNGNNAVLIATTLGNQSTVELLARVRPMSLPPGEGWLGGLAVGAATNAAGEYSSQLGANQGVTQIGIFGPGATAGPLAAATWTTNRWYWLRVRHQTNALTNYPDLLTRLWPANGETSEPEQWRTWYDYFPAHPEATGQVGLVTGQGWWEVDWLLVKADDLPEILARLPAPKPAYAQLRPIDYTPETGIRLELRGDPGVGYYLEHTSDFSEWTGPALLIGSNGVVEYQDAETATQRFYRARLVE